MERIGNPPITKKYTPLITGLIIGLMWSTWHLPLHLHGNYGDGWSSFLLRFIYNVLTGIFFTWFYNKSHGNLLGAVVLHASTNCFASWNLFPSGILISLVVTIFVVFYNKMWKKLPRRRKY
ncbi:MAG: membrane protein of unknown function [Promethearchaeota archaeon]|nr:MAG: membrane protein of unknown function [Candidatus Lokiarchaeota archaeon]